MGNQSWPPAPASSSESSEEAPRVTDYGILRYPDGRTERLSGMQGPMGGMLHRWAARTQAA